MLLLEWGEEFLLAK